MTSHFFHINKSENFNGAFAHNSFTFMKKLHQIEHKNCEIHKFQEF